MLRLMLIVVVALALGFAPVPFPKPDPSAADLKAIQGEWVNASRPTIGYKVEKDTMGVYDHGELCTRLRIVLKGATLPKSFEMFNVTYDPDDPSPTVHGVYKLDKATLTI